jgi:hypothetical protein
MMTLENHLTAPCRTRKNDHRKSHYVPDARAGNRVFSPRELAEAINDQSVLDNPLPEITTQEKLTGWVAGWKRTVTCTTREGGGRFTVVSSLEQWVLGKWPRQM